MVNLILCGGAGTRLWPLSRVLMPKQFVKIFGEYSLFQRTVLVNSSFCSQQCIVSNAEQYFLAKEQLQQINAGKTSFMLEPVGRNTAPAIALACLGLSEDDVVLVSPSDHLIRDAEAYSKAVAQAAEFAKAGNLVTFGLKPTGPETGYGYIEAEGDKAKRFVEKPDLETAKKYVASGNFYWNSGIFCFKAGVFLEELNKYAPDMLAACKEAYEKAAVEASMVRVHHEDMAKIPADSIDYAVMEKSKKVSVVPCAIGWSDLGSFESLYGELPHDEDGNTEDKNHIAVDSKNNLVMSSNRQITTIDLNDMMVVDTADALLVAPLASCQKVKNLVEKLRSKQPDLLHSPQTVVRPWGTYTVIYEYAHFKVKCISVNPGARISLQKHLYRSEHWVVVSGMATATVNDKTVYVSPNESIYISAGSIHRLQNEGKLPLVIVEVQVGQYTGEDDIIRVEDDYKRHECCSA
ncbi:MAG: mannose-1-phosphate guanylyltransferase/mannose-6-phosphate isomerase [Fibromonadaceae bacterium]|jgi:mannose-1-phosphate guanylyltransferase|nr:mannose-1-phosphate guanylyltransferase/mannose-6-phosphate isomerase [Fibromonadaceae bacterium]